MTDTPLMTETELKDVVGALAKLTRSLLTAAVDFGYRRVRELMARDTGPREYTYIGGLEPDRPDGYLPGDEGEALWRPNTPAGTQIKLIDLIIIADNSFIVADVRAAGDTLLASHGHVPVEVFAPAVMNRGFETNPVPFDHKHPLVVKFYRRGNPLPGDSPRPFWAAAKVRSSLPPSSEYPQGDRA